MYVDALTAPRTLSDIEAAKLLRVTGEHRDGFRDHVIFAVALGTGLREHEILALNFGDLFNAQGGVRTRVVLKVYKRSNDDPNAQEVVLPDQLRRKLVKLRENMIRDGLPTGAADPVFVSARRTRLSERMLRHAFGEWQERAGFDRHHNFHSLRHTAITSLYQGTLDIRLAQKFARHADVKTTQRYTHPSDSDLERAVQGLRC